MKNNKRAQVYSFKALSSQAQSQTSLSQSRKSQPHEQHVSNHIQSNIKPNSKPFQASSQYSNKIKQGIFRHEGPYKSMQQQPELKYDISFKKPQLKQYNKFNYGPQLQLHPKISSLDQEIEGNVKRRLQLENDLNQLRKIQKDNQKSSLGLSYVGNQGQSYNGNNLSSTGIQKEFALRNKESDFVDQMVLKGTQKQTINKSKMSETAKTQQRLSYKEKEQQLNKNIEILTDTNMQSILQKGFQQTKKDFYDLQSFLGIDKQNSQTKPNSNKKPLTKQIQSPTPPPITVIQQLLSRLTFPQIPKQSIQKLSKKCEQLYAIHESHSDLVYMMMVGCFHMGDYHGVRKYFKEILTFKKFQTKAYWVAMEAEYVLENYQRCIKLSEYCMENLDDKYLPRFIYLKAKCYYELGNFTNSIVCYNQLIRIKPKIPEYYLQRAVLYDKLGYEKQCKQDYLMFGILKPQAKKYLQEKIMVEQNDGKRKELLQIYKKMV